MLELAAQTKMRKKLSREREGPQHLLARAVGVAERDVVAPQKIATTIK